MMHSLSATWIIARREWLRTLRQPMRIMAALATALLLWAFFAAGFGPAMGDGAGGLFSYSAFVLPGAITLTAVFSAVFTSLSVIDDRTEGWLQCVIIAPSPRWSIALGKSVGGAVIALVQAALLLLLLPLIDRTANLAGVGLALVPLAVTCLAMTALGVAFAWRSPDAASFHAVMNVVFMPMWLLSGAIFPQDSAAGPMRWLVAVNPLGWCTHAVRSALEGDVATWPMAAACGFALACVLAAVTVVRSG